MVNAKVAGLFQRLLRPASLRSQQFVAKWPLRDACGTPGRIADNACIPVTRPHRVGYSNGLGHFEKA